MSSRRLLCVPIALLCVMLMLLSAPGVNALRRDSDDEYGYDEPPAANDNYADADQYTQQAPPSGDQPTGSTQQEEGEDPSKKTLASSFVPIIAILFASKTVPSLDVGGSSIPMLISVMIIPRLIAYLETQYDLTDLPQMQGMLLVAAISVTQFAMVVNVGKTLGFFKPAGEGLVGKPAETLSDELQYVQGAPMDVHRAGSIKVVEFWATWCGPCKTAIPHLNKLWKELVTEYGADKIQFVGITQEDESVEKIKDWIRDEMSGNMEYAVAIDSKSTTSAGYPNSGIPHAYVVGPDGTILWAGHPSKMGEVVREKVQEMVYGADGGASSDAAPAKVKAAKPKMNGLKMNDAPKKGSTVEQID